VIEIDPLGLYFSNPIDEMVQEGAVVRDEDHGPDNSSGTPPARREIQGPGNSWVRPAGEGQALGEGFSPVRCASTSLRSVHLWVA